MEYRRRTLSVTATRAMAGAATMIAVAGLTAFTVRRSPQNPVEERVGARDEPARRSTLLPDAEEVDAAFRDARQRMVFGLVSVIISGFWLGVFLGLTPWGLTPPVFNQMTIIDAWRTGAAGWLTPAEALAVVLALLGVIATINVAVSFPAMPRAVRDQVATTFWSSALYCVTWGTAVCAVALGTIAWSAEKTATNFRATVGASLAVDVLAIACALLVATIGVGSENAAKRRRSLSQVEMRLNQLRRRRISVFREVEDSVSGDDAEWTGWRRAGMYIVRLVIVSIAVALLTSLIVAAFALLSDERPSVLRLIVIVGGGVGLMTVVISFYSYRRWSEYHRNERWALSVTPWVFRVLWVAMAFVLGFAIDFSQSDSWWVLAAILIVLAVPLVPVMLLWAGRPDRSVSRTFLGWPGRLVWEDVAASIDMRCAELDERRSELLAAVRA